MHQECSDDVHQMTLDHPERFKGFAQIPMEHVPADMRIDWPVAWILVLKSPTQEEKEAILYKNLETLLGL
jgi:predicted TIM-barrel fold metal-dependent hydrolase